MQRTWMTRLLAAMMGLSFLSLSLSGCTREAEGVGEGAAPRPPILAEEPVEDGVIIGLDLSGSFLPKMLNDGKAWKLATRVVDEMFRSRLTNNDQLLIAQLSGNNTPLLWQGKPRELRRAFSSADDFRTALLSNSDAAGSRIHAGIADAIEFYLNDVRLRNSSRAALLVCSDMLDTTPDREKSEERLVKALTAFGKRGGVVGMYWVSVHPDLVSVWRRNLERAGVKGVVEGSIVHAPKLPKWD